MRKSKMQSSRIQTVVLMAVLLLLSACASEYVPPTVSAAPKDWLPEVAEFKAESDAPEPSDALLRILWKYAPDSFYIINRDENLPAVVKFGSFGWTIKRQDDVNQSVTYYDGSTTTTSKSESGFRRWIFSTDPLKQINELSTATHEDNHRYTADFAVPQLAEATKGNIAILRSPEYVDNRATLYFSYYLNRHRTRFNRLYPTFPVREMASYIPQANRSGRYDSYVVGDGSFQEVGIFTLLDEYNATYWSQRTMFDLYNYYLAELPLTADTWLTYFEGQGGTFLSWGEFRYFFLTYLLFAKDNHPDVYQKLLADERFRTTFTEIDDQYIDLQKHVITRLTKELPAYLQSKGLNVSVLLMPGQNAKLHFVFSIDADGRSLLWGEYQATSRLLRTPAYMAMANQFRTTPSPELPPMEIENLTGTLQ